MNRDLPLTLRLSNIQAAKDLVLRFLDTPIAVAAGDETDAPGQGVTTHQSFLKKP
jgi:hypothetical protein